MVGGGIVMKYIYPKDCPYRSLHTLKDEKGEFHICSEEGDDYNIYEILPKLGASMKMANL